MPEEQNIDFEGQLVWGRFIADPNVLHSSGRTELKQYLERLLAGLRHRHMGSASQTFPTTAELTRLTEVVTLLAKGLGIKKAGFGDLPSARKRIENRWGKMPLISFADELVERLCKIPASPRAEINHAMGQCGKVDVAHKTLLAQVDRFLNCRQGGVDYAAPWQKWHAAVKGLKVVNAFWSDVSQVQAESALLYRVLQDSVDESIQDIGYLPITMPMVTQMDTPQTGTATVIKMAMATCGSAVLNKRN